MQIYVKKCQCIGVQFLESERGRNELSETQELLQLKCEVLTLGAVLIFQIGYGEKRIFKNLRMLVCAISSQKPEIRMNSLRICVE